MAYVPSATPTFEKDRIRALKNERINSQKKTFTKWVNSFLDKVSVEITSWRLYSGQTHAVNYVRVILQAELLRVQMYIAQGSESLLVFSFSVNYVTLYILLNLFCFLCKLKAITPFKCLDQDESLESPWGANFLTTHVCHKFL